MMDYIISVVTSRKPDAGTYSRVFVSLIGTEGTSDESEVGRENVYLSPGSKCSTKISCHHNLGKILLVTLRKEQVVSFPDLNWHCQDIWVEAPDGQKYYFPCNKWLCKDSNTITVREGWARKLNEDDVKQLQDHRIRELEEKRKIYKWHIHVEHVSHCVNVPTVEQLSPNIKYTRVGPGLNLHYLRGFTECTESWRSMEQLSKFFALNKYLCSPVAEYVKIHWQEDAFFGYQFLNGCNPYMVSQSRTLPRKFPVTEEMVKTLLPAGTSLKLELEKGNIFLADYEVLQGVPANIVNGRQQFLTTPLCLLHKTEEGQLLPIAIQLNQTPGPQNPIFLPSDSEPDWLLAKIWVRNSDFFCHQILSHYLKTHMLGEIYCIATLRQLPEVHPLHKLIICHVWTTLQINIQARNSLLAKGGVFDKSIGCGLEGVGVLLQRGMSQLHYNDLCLPDDLRQRGLDQLASCYFAEDGLKVWGAIHRFVEKLLQFFYPSDLAVQNDIELQSWIKEIFTEGFLGQESKGFPQSFKTTAEVVKFVTMVIFTCSAQHAAVNFSQLDYNIWMPNCPATMGKPPPKVKGALQLEDILSYLPDVNATCSVLITLSLLSSPSKDFIPLGGYHEGIFSEETAQKLILEFQAELAHIVSEIKQRTTKLELPYDYLRPDLIENSVSI